MTLLGDLERTFATLVFPNLLLVAILAAIAACVLLVVGRRRGWDRAVARHRRVAIGAVVVLLAVGLPTGWYLASPLFIRTELVEAAPAPVATSAPAAAASPTSTSRATAAPPASVGVPSAPPTAVRRGEFVGADSFHYGRGSVSVLASADGVVLRFEDFDVLNGPDLYVYVSSDPSGYSTGAIEVAQLKATKGSFNVPLPAGVDPAGVRSVVIWCKAFAVQFAHAELPAG